MPFSVAQMPLTDNLSAFWDFEDDDVLDQHGSTDWTENGTITYTSSTWGRAVVVSGGGNTLSVPNASATDILMGTDDWTFCCKFKSNTFPVAFNTLFALGGSGTGDPGIIITHKSNGEFLIRVATSTAQVQQTYNQGNIAVDTEGFLAVRVNRTTGNLSVKTDSNSWRNTDISTFGSDSMSATANAFVANYFQNNGDFTISMMGIWARELSDAEIDDVRDNIDTYADLAGGDDYTLSGNELDVATSLDAGAITQNHILTPADSSVSVSLDGSTINQIHILSPAELDLTVSLDAGGVVVAGDDYTLSADDLAVSTTLDTTTVSQVHILSPVDGSVSAVIDTTQITQVHILSPAELAAAVTIDSTLVVLPSEVSTGAVSLGSTYSATVSLGTFG